MLKEIEYKYKNGETEIFHYTIEETHENGLPQFTYRFVEFDLSWTAFSEEDIGVIRTKIYQTLEFKIDSAK